MNRPQIFMHLHILFNFMCSYKNRNLDELGQASAVMYSMRSREYDVAGAASVPLSPNASTYRAYWTIWGELS